MHAYLITTKPVDSIPIQRIQERLIKMNFQVTIIEGVKGAQLQAGDFFRMIQFWRAHTSRIMTPGELGCALSHHKALTLAAAAEPSVSRHLILEDDFIASDEALQWISAACTKLRPGLLLHFGGLEGSPSRLYRYIRSISPPDEFGLVEIDHRDMEYLKRTVAYAVDSLTARKLAELIQQTPYVVDDYAYAASKGAISNIRFRWVISHPTDPTESAIEHERASQALAGKRKSWKTRTWNEINRKRRLQFSLLWRRITTNPERFLLKQQAKNQLPVTESE